VEKIALHPPLRLLIGKRTLTWRRGGR